jgi:hypothetical protein
MRFELMESKNPYVLFPLLVIGIYHWILVGFSKFNLGWFLSLPDEV